MDLSAFIQKLRDENELVTITEPVSTELEITEITDRISKGPASQNKALLFTNNSSQYPVLTNAFGSEKRICLALNCEELDFYRIKIEHLLKSALQQRQTFADKLSVIPMLSQMKNWFPTHLKKKGACQEVIEGDVDLTKLPILQCWKHDAGRFVTLPLVITKHPLTQSRNMGMYRMQVVDKQTTGMHWHQNKTGASHYEAYKRLGRKMPVSVAIGGSPASIFAATAPLPENIDEAILTGFLQNKSVRLVKCITNDLEVPADADFVLEGYVDPQEEKFLEGPFGDHTGFYSLPDYYPKFHVTCITHKKQAIYPATIVGIPPMEDAWMGKATERIFLAPIQFLFCPEMLDYVMPFEGVSHNLVVVQIRKAYLGQVQKVINALWGAGQMANNKTMIVVGEECNIKDKAAIRKAVEMYYNPCSDTVIQQGPLDVLDHSSPVIGFGSKLAIDATQKDVKNDNKIVFLAVGEDSHEDKIAKARDYIEKNPNTCCITLYDKQLNADDTYSILWNVLNNYNPSTDCVVYQNCLILDGSSKVASEQVREWPTPVLSDEATIRLVDEKWERYGLGNYIESPSKKYQVLASNKSAWRNR